MVKLKTKTKNKKISKAASKDSSVDSISIGDSIWPIERDILYRPDRLKYVRKLIKPKGCVFCTAANAKVGISHLVVKRTQYSMVVLNKFPYNPGHVLVMPIRHCGELLKLSLSEYNDLQGLIRETYAALTEAFDPSGINLGLNHGSAAGAGIPEHLHYHIIPRWKGDLNFFPLIAETKVIPTTLESTYDRLSRVLK
jgi:ATP adenylyltransferase